MKVILWIPPKVAENYRWRRIQMTVTLSCLRAAKSASTTAALGRRPRDNIGNICKLFDEDMLVLDPLTLSPDWSPCSYTVSSAADDDDFDEASLMTGDGCVDDSSSSKDKHSTLVHLKQAKLAVDRPTRNCHIHLPSSHFQPSLFISWMKNTHTHTNNHTSLLW